MTPERSKILGELLLEMSEDPRGFIPDEAWLPAQKAFALPYVEMAIVRRSRKRIQILLAHRSDEYWVGWHLPGGLWRTRQTLQDCIASLAEIELGEGIRVSLLAQGMWEKWHDHPYGSIISHVAICLAENTPGCRRGSGWNLFGAISGNLKLSDQAARSIG
jgi:ADP-ribose pyrophosphatase YjhB (NUDIX family)